MIFDYRFLFKSWIYEKIMNIIKENPGLSENAYMGTVMKELKGKISGKDATDIINRLIKK